MKSWFCAAALALLLCFGAQPSALAQEAGPNANKGENFSAKPPAALFASDCTGAGCHKGPQSLGKGQSQSSLAGFLREHYTNSRESAAALAGYLTKLPAGAVAEPREARPRPARGEPASGEGFFSGAGEAKPEAKQRREAKPEPGEARTSRQHPAPKTSRAAAKPEEKPEESTEPAADSKEAAPKEKEPAAAEAVPKEKEAPAKHVPPKPTTRAQRAKAAAAAAAAPPPVPEPPPAPPPPPPKKEYDIFD